MIVSFGSIALRASVFGHEWSPLVIFSYGGRELDIRMSKDKPCRTHYGMRTPRYLANAVEKTVAQCCERISRLRFTPTHRIDNPVKRVNLAGRHTAGFSSRRRPAAAAFARCSKGKPGLASAHEPDLRRGSKLVTTDPEWRFGRDHLIPPIGIQQIDRRPRIHYVRASRAGATWARRSRAPAYLRGRLCQAWLPCFRPRRFARPTQREPGGVIDLAAVNALSASRRPHGPTRGFRKTGSVRPGQRE
jgi:hypothetical protein